MRRESEKGKIGNSVSSWVVPLPLDEERPIDQLRRIHAHTQELKESNQADIVEQLHNLLQWLSVDVQAASKGVMNMIVTNVPGPQFPLYLLGARLLESYPQAPLLENLGLAIAIFSYDGNIFWGLNADYDRVPDLHSFAQNLQAAIEELAKEADVTLGVHAQPEAALASNASKSARERVRLVPNPKKARSASAKAKAKGKTATTKRASRKSNGKAAAKAVPTNGNGVHSEISKTSSSTIVVSDVTHEATDSVQPVKRTEAS